MKTNRYFNFTFLIIFIMLLSGCSSLNSQFTELYSSNDPAPEDINSDIVDSHIFDDARLPHIKTLNYKAYQAASDRATTDQFYSNYQVDLVRTAGKLTQYNTSEVTTTGETLQGKGVGYGGIFSIEHIRQGKVPPKRPFFIKDRWTTISNIQGKLFPLRLDNKLEFDFTEQVNKPGKKEDMTEQVDHGHIVYEVIGHQKGYVNGDMQIPGEIFLIRFSKAIGNGPLLPKNDYYFSNYLGWYVQDNYYLNGIPKAIYKLSACETSLDMKKPTTTQ